MKKWLFIFFGLAHLVLFAQQHNEVVLGSCDPDFQYDTYEDWRETHPLRPTYCREINRVETRIRTEKVLLVVNDTLLTQIGTALETYRNDLLDDGISSILLSFSGTSIEDLKAQLQLYYTQENISGAVLIGDLPAAWYEIWRDWNHNGIAEEGEVEDAFPCELYFSDLDGNWIDAVAGAAFDGHNGEIHPEIALGRISAYNLDMTGLGEVALLNDYFQRNHWFRLGVFTTNDSALVYVEDDWSQWGYGYLEEMQEAYPDAELVNNINETTAEDYLTNRLIRNYDWIHLMAHSSPRRHCFMQNNGQSFVYVYNYDVTAIQTKAYFYNLVACSNSRFTYDNNMGAVYIYGDSQGLATVGSTKDGGMKRCSSFYQALEQEETIGEALCRWWDVAVDPEPNLHDQIWYYGLVIQGDPFLKKSYQKMVTVSVPQDYPTIQQAIDAAQDSTTIYVMAGTYTENLVIADKIIFLIAADNVEDCIIDGGNNGASVIQMANADSSEICGFTIQNGTSSGNGGGLQITGFCTIKNCIISDNEAVEGGGIFVQGEARIIHNQIMNNQASVLGGGIACVGDRAILQRNQIADNSTAGQGGGLHISCSGISNVENNIIHSNSAQLGGGISSSQTQATIILTNNLIYGNSADEASALALSENGYVMMNNTIVDNEFNETGLLFVDESQGFLLNNIIWNNAAQELQVFSQADVQVYYCDVEGGYGGEGNLNAPPQFTNSTNADYSLADSSPCIAAGKGHMIVDEFVYSAPQYDINGNSRTLDGMIDMGAYESAPRFPDMIVEADSMDWGEIAIGSSAIRNFSILNEGEADLRISRLIVTENQFSVATSSNGEYCDSLSDLVILPQEELLLSLKFAPTIEDTFRASLMICSNDVDESQREIILLGEGVYGTDAEIASCPETLNALSLFCHPNPFNPETTIQFTLPQSGKVELTVYNIKGQKVKTLIQDELQSGTHSILWNGCNENDEDVASGVYFYRLETAKQTINRKMVLMK